MAQTAAQKAAYQRAWYRKNRAKHIRSAVKKVTSNVHVKKNFTITDPVSGEKAKLTTVVVKPQPRPEFDNYVDRLEDITNHTFTPSELITLYKNFKP